MQQDVTTESSRRLEGPSLTALACRHKPIVQRYSPEVFSEVGFCVGKKGERPAGFVYTPCGAGLGFGTLQSTCRFGKIVGDAFC